MAATTFPAAALLVAVGIILLMGVAPRRNFAYIPPSVAELVPKSAEMMERVAQVVDKVGDRLVTPQDASAMVDAGAMLIDVRTPMQIHSMTEDKSIEKAIIDPFDDWVKYKKPTNAIKYAYEFGRKIIVTCTAGPKSTLAWEFLKEHGIDAYVIKGGFSAWEEAGLPTHVNKFHGYDLK
eukprot:CAMPEP_0172660460 /NCGR_PEP_ID=MMETSP1074-20121228/4079_1 /TAXON_ID=2916 /ORGANISM="Ceratium fusus, Strain PA161109" /LENGTH=178 /DNA_ID=CAMNT_0013476079 /DNA_START=151 /DNA_END=688 /DNA_ORIENTATION=+